MRDTPSGRSRGLRRCGQEARAVVSRHQARPTHPHSPTRSAAPKPSPPNVPPRRAEGDRFARRGGGGRPWGVWRCGQEACAVVSRHQAPPTASHRPTRAAALEPPSRAPCALRRRRGTEGMSAGRECGGRRADRLSTGGGKLTSVRPDSILFSSNKIIFHLKLRNSVHIPIREPIFTTRRCSLTSRSIGSHCRTLSSLPEITAWRCSPYETYRKHSPSDNKHSPGATANTRRHVVGVANTRRPISNTRYSVLFSLPDQ